MATRPFSTCACYRLRRAPRAVTQLYDDAMAPTGLRITQYGLLRTLADEGPRTITGLAQALLLDRTALSRTLDPLIDRSLVAVTPGSDARTREVSLTTAGRNAVEAAGPHWNAVQTMVARSVGRARLDDLYALLEGLETLHPGAGR